MLTISLPCVVQDKPYIITLQVILQYVLHTLGIIQQMKAVIGVILGRMAQDSGIVFILIHNQIVSWIYQIGYCTIIHITK